MILVDIHTVQYEQLEPYTVHQEDRVFVTNWFRGNTLQVAIPIDPTHTVSYCIDIRQSIHSLVASSVLQYRSEFQVDISKDCGVVYILAQQYRSTVNRIQIQQYRSSTAYSQPYYTYPISKIDPYRTITGIEFGLQTTTFGSSYSFQLIAHRIQYSTVRHHSIVDIDIVQCIAIPHTVISYFSIPSVLDHTLVSFGHSYIIEI